MRREAGSSEDEADGESAPADHDLVTRFGKSDIERDIRPRAIVDTGANVVWSSPSAARMLCSPYPVYLKKRQLCFEDGPARQDGEAFFGGLGYERSRLMLTSREGELWVLITGWAEHVDRQRLIFLTFCLCEPTASSRENGLAHHYGLTPTEAAVLDQFARLRSPSEIADELRVTLNTVRSHLKRLHTKLAVNTNTKLLQIARAFGDS